MAADAFDQAAADLRQLLEDHPWLEPNVRDRGLALLERLQQER